MRCRSGLWLIVATGLLQGCQLFNFQPKLCSMEALPALRVHVVDAETGKSLLMQSTIRIQDGDYADSATPTEPAISAVNLAYERSGNYKVQVERTGYHPWKQENIRVRKGECHVQTIELEAKLRKLEP